jgi:PglZ domain
MSVLSPLVATEPIIRARLKKASAKQYRRGVLGLRATPIWDGDGFEHDGTPVTVVACPSVLSIWEAIGARHADEWTVVLTNVDDDDLGDTVLAHLLDGRLITPDPWDALRSNFSASTIEPALYRSTNDRAVANGLLTVLSAATYTPAPGGVLTRNHAMSTVAREVLDIVSSTDVEVDALAIQEWSRQADAPQRWVDLRAGGGVDLSAAVNRWLADRAGQLAHPLTALLGGDRIADLVPLGVVAGVFCQDATADPVALGKFLERYRLSTLSADDLNTWYTSARGLLTTALANPQTVLQSAASIVNDLGISTAAASSDLLPHGLEARLNALADAVTAALPHPLPEDLDAAVIPANALQHIEARWAEVRQHFLAGTSPTVDAFSGAVRLARWLAEPVTSARGLSEAAGWYVRRDSWVDTALTKARRGGETPIVAAALRGLIDTTLARRSRHDLVFAAALADAPQPAVQTIENVLRDLVVPIARKVPTLLLVVDALSMAAANELVLALQQDGWTEISPTAGGQRTGALAVLPTLTQRSRCSLLCGELREGAHGVERSGFLSLIRDARLEATGGVPDPIFHKKALDAIPSGASLASDVGNAIADVDRQKLVAVVLNYVDDTLHHTDPGGTDWTIATITHLRALLQAAKSAGRAVVITSDHGHIIEYGTSAMVDRANTYGQRAHGDFARVDADREIVIEGPRVLTDSHRVVMAVDETIRYGARNAGYHGGATPAEAIVPVLAFLCGVLPGWAVPVAAAEPSWWHRGAVETVAPPVPSREKKVEQEPSLFDDVPAEQVNPLPDNVIRSKVFASQLRLAGRIVVKPPQIQNLLVALVGAGAHELTLAQAAAALGVATTSVNGALTQAKRVLDVEGYEVLRVRDGVVGLDVAALKEQFGVSE